MWNKYSTADAHYDIVQQIVEASNCSKEVVTETVVVFYYVSSEWLILRLSVHRKLFFLRLNSSQFNPIRADLTLLDTTRS